MMRLIMVIVVLFCDACYMLFIVCLSPENFMFLYRSLNSQQKKKWSMDEKCTFFFLIKYH